MKVLIVLPESSLEELTRMKARLHITSIEIIKERPETKASPSPSPIRHKKTRACRIIDSEAEEDEEDAISTNETSRNDDKVDSEPKASPSPSPIRRKKTRARRIVDSEEEKDEEEAISRKQSFDEDDDVISEPKSSSADEEDSIIVVESDSDEEKEENSDSEASPKLVNTTHCSFVILEAEEEILSKSLESKNDDVSDDEESFHLVGKFTLDDKNDSKPKRFITKNSIVFDLEEDFTLDITPSPVQRPETTDKNDDDDDDDLTFHLEKLRLDDEDDDSSWKKSKKLTEESEMSPSPIQAKKTQKRRILYSDDDEDEEKATDSDDDDLPLFSLDDDSEEKKKKKKKSSGKRTVIACSDTDSDAENDPKLETTKEVDSKTMTKKKKKRRVSFWNLGNSVTPFKTATPHMATPSYSTLYKGLRTPKSATSFLKTPQTAIGKCGQYSRHKSSLISDLFVIYNESVFDGKLPVDLKFEWNARLTSTAGSCAYTWKNDERSATITLSTKIIDSYERLRDTLIHELCHAATWIIDNDRHAHHGPIWKKWVRIAESVHPELPCVSRCHNYSINTKYTYICQNSDCYFSEGRHSKSINLDRARCPVCMSRLQLMNKSGHSSAARSNPYCDFVKQNFARVQRENPHLKFHEISKILASQYRTPAKF